jgi:hypothetical protein
MAPIDAGAHSEHVQVIRCNIKPGSVERSTDLGMAGYNMEELEGNRTRKDNVIIVLMVCIKNTINTAISRA